MNIKEKDFISQFEDYSEVCTPLGVRVPEVSLEKHVINRFNLDVSKGDDDILRQLCLVGYKNKRIDQYPNKKEYIYRIKHELEVLKKLGFSRYILLIWASIQWCDDNEVPRGWGRGSVASSLVVYLLGMVSVDPIKYGLIFERFINESRAQPKIINGEMWCAGDRMPDIDADVCYFGRDKLVQEYLDVKYKGRTSYISTLNTLSTKLVLKEVCKKYGGFSEHEANKISNLIESDAGKLDSLEDTLEKNSQFKEWVDSHESLYKVATKICDLPRNFGVHAAGIVLSYDEVVDTLPLELKTDSEGKERLVTAYTKDDAAELVLKGDYLGLKTVSIIYNTAKEVGYDINNFDVEHPDIYKFLQTFEHTYGIFQLDGGTASRVTRRVKPNSFKDVAAISAIARPGALAFLDQFLETRETGKIKSIYPPIDEILKETNGVILMQEQIMAISSKVYGFSLLEADTIRKVIGKKQIDKVAEWEDKIKKAGKEKGVPDDATQLFWETVQAAAKYSFNASHAYAYSYISTLCVFLKVNYPAHFFKNCLILARTFQDSDARIQQICKELPHFGVSLKPPDLIKSSDDFTVDGNTIRYGLQSIKSVSEKSLAKLKNFNTDVKNKFALFQAAKEAGINIGILSNLIKAGCLSSFGENRGMLMLEAASWNLLTESQKTKIVKYGPKYEYNLLNILFDIKEGKLLHGGKEIISTKKRATKAHPEGSSPWDSFYRKYEKFKGEYHSYQRRRDFYNYMYESDVLGFSYSKKLHEILKKEYKDIVHFGQLLDMPIDSKVITCGVVQDAKVGKTKKFNKKLTLYLSDEYGEARCMTFNYEKYDRETHEREMVKNVDDLYNDYGRYPAKKDLIILKGTLKEGNLIFADKIRILNLNL